MNAFALAASAFVAFLAWDVFRRWISASRFNESTIAMLQSQAKHRTENLHARLEETEKRWVTWQKTVDDKIHDLATRLHSVEGYEAKHKEEWRQLANMIAQKNAVARPNFSRKV
jgi:hypothetical protein